VNSFWLLAHRGMRPAGQNSCARAGVVHGALRNRGTGRRSRGPTCGRGASAGEPAASCSCALAAYPRQATSAHGVNFIPYIILLGWSKNIFIPCTQFAPAVSLFCFPIRGSHHSSSFSPQIFDFWNSDGTPSSAASWPAGPHLDRALRRHPKSSAASSRRRLPFPPPRHPRPGLSGDRATAPRASLIHRAPGRPQRCHDD
jgi:hypothetical protein